MENKESKIVTFSGPTGGGKDTIIDEILKRCENCTKLLGATTRPPRATERHEVDYYFLSKEEFLQGIESEDIPEHWQAPYNNEYYGKYLPEFRKKVDQGKTVLTVAQIDGVKYFKEHYDPITIFIMPKSLDILRDRILSRDTIDQKELQERVEEAEREVQEAKENASFYDYIVVNEDGKLEESVEEVLSILQKHNFVAI